MVVKSNMTTMPGFKGRDFTYEGQPQLGSALKPGEINSSDPEDLYIWYSNITIGLGDYKFKWARLNTHCGIVHVWVDEIHQNGPAICQGADNVF